MKTKFLNLYKLVLFPFLFFACDLIGGSISEFIDFNTFNARIIEVSITSMDPNNIIKTRQAWIHDPVSVIKPGIIEFEAVIDNPHNYSLIVTPVITEFIGLNGIKGPAPQNMPVFIGETLAIAQYSERAHFFSQYAGVNVFRHLIHPLSGVPQSSPLSVEPAVHKHGAAQHLRQHNALWFGCLCAPTTL